MVQHNYVCERERERERARDSIFLFQCRGENYRISLNCCYSLEYIFMTFANRFAALCNPNSCRRAQWKPHHSKVWLRSMYTVPPPWLHGPACISSRYGGTGCKRRASPLPSALLSLTLAGLCLFDKRTTTRDDDLTSRWRTHVQFWLISDLIYCFAFG